MSNQTPAAAPAPSPSTCLIQAPETPDDEPIVHPSLQRYIANLSDSHTNYARFFSALLIPQDAHPQFFHDLKQFREQPTIIYLLNPGTRENYRETSRNFVGSRFAHPWCRVQSDFGKGWHRASWVGDTDVAGRGKVKKEEDRLHRLLVPIWIAMRRRMFPADEIVENWNEEEDLNAAEKARLTKENPLPLKSEPSSSTAAATYPELGFAFKDSPSLSSTVSASPKPPDPVAQEAAKKMFVGAAVAGFVMSDKRVKKYVQKKLLKKK